MAYVSVDIELEDIDTRHLIDELENRYLNEQEQRWLINLVKANDGGKLDLFLKNRERFTLIELEEMFKEKFPVSNVPKEQLSLL